MGKEFKIVTVSMTVSEYESLNKIAQEDPETKTMDGRVNISAYVRKCIFSPIGRPRDMKKEIRELNFQIRKIGVNINQVAKRINSGYPLADDDSFLLSELRKVEELLLDTYKKIEEGKDGNYEIAAYKKE